MTQRYAVYAGSKSSHCCFDATVVDTTKPEFIGGEHYKDIITGQFHYETVCECFTEEDAKLVCNAMNADECDGGNRTMSDTRNESAYPCGDDKASYERGFTKRQRAAIELRVPDSGEEWLDAMIRKANRREMVEMALNGYFSNGSVLVSINLKGGESPARKVVEVADDQLAALEGDA